MRRCTRTAYLPHIPPCISPASELRRCTRTAYYAYDYDYDSNNNNYYYYHGDAYYYYEDEEDDDDCSTPPNTMVLLLPDYPSTIQPLSYGHPTAPATSTGGVG